ncbi:rhodanese-like domain-containing protein 8, chloroplastic isoform X3 [Glycine soja]|uniref:Rhodanese domain-containing protein n=1 Tax=Glycine max TaxID=3847 RepID=A0A0R0K6E7_SOYBN|nr:rhodanese-like domain-containing protein 8, chloroplastic isoform X3 [Glycine max]XP_028234110.1 rhodanese-like domain-containing protein 8, chloroplastic isoform X3 [Glycine soja]|eukprot:XP_006580384.1 rhodanese-like domain-containing protein 8, chloroplastic isoform X3 [Glycine max]
MRWCSQVFSVSGSGAHAHALALAPIVTASFSNTSLVLQFQKPLFKFSNSSSLALTHRKLLPSALPLTQPSSSREDFDFVVVNFYHFVFIQDPQAEVDKHRSFLQLEGLDINGRLYLNEQGINAQYSGPSKDAMTYVNWLRKDNRFSDILVQISPSEKGHTFPTLKLRYKPSLVQFEGGMSHLSLLDPSMRAIPLSPSEWRDRLESINKTDLTAKDNSNRNYILLDVRNGYEWDIGHFRGAQRPSVDCFRNTSFGLSREEITASDPLSNVDKEKANILMYCTGGIRCDVYSSILRQQGFQNLYTLKGGVSHYLKNEGPAEWVGNLFVFDSRLSLPPSIYYTGATTEAESTPVSGDDNFAKCYVCSLEVSELRHRNCANLDCNLLFLLCHADAADNVQRI